MKIPNSKIPTIVLAVSGFVAAFAANAKADVVIVREEVYERPVYWHGERIVHYNDRGERVIYREYNREPVYYREHVYREYPRTPARFETSNQYDVSDR